MARVIVFTGQMGAMEEFYGGVFGLTVAAREPGWVELSAGYCTIALHDWKGKAPEGPIKIVFYAADVDLVRQRLTAKGAPSGKIVRFGDIQLWDTFDPDGNAIQVSSRKRVSGAVA